MNDQNQPGDDANPGYSPSTRMEFAEDRASSPLDRPTLGDVVAQRYGRREVLRGALAMTAAAAITAPWKLGGAQAASGAAEWNFQFPELEAAVDETHHVAEGYNADVLIRWGDPVVPGAPEFDPKNLTADAQERQFGYNNDFTGFVSLPFGSHNPDRGLLGVNHEYTNAELMFPNYDGATAERVAIEMAAHGHSVFEVERNADGKWQVKTDSPYNRRYTTRSAWLNISGPAAGHWRLQTGYDPSGTRVMGTVNNCAGGVTPWNTVLVAEENFHGYFKGELADAAEVRNHKRYGVPGGWYDWGDYDSRFDIGQEPKEPNRFGWMVEYDPYDPNFTPVKRTGMGRFKHEGAETVENRDGRAVSVMGDDQRFEYVYKFVSSGKIDPNNRSANFGLLDDGTLFAARFNSDGSVEWRPLVYGAGPLTSENGFTSQGEVLLEARRAADLMGATPMDRPEDVALDPDSGKIYVMLTSNEKRKPEATHPANPRAGNSAGHIVEITATNGDLASVQDTWDILVLAGDPNDPAANADWGPATSKNGWFVNPDNAQIDNRGRLWVTTDGNSQANSGRADGVWAMETEGELRGSSKHFFRCPVGAEMCGPFFTPDDTTFFVAVQHPGDVEGASFEKPGTRWPDFDESLPVRPGLVAITRPDGGKIA